MVAARDALPPRFRSPYHLRPDLREAVASDPTEAVHSAEIPTPIRDYLDIVEWHDLGGGIAYEVLWNHVDPFTERSDEAQRELQVLLDTDEELSGTPGIPHLFAFIIGRRKRTRPPVSAHYRRLVFEPLREAIAERTGYLYPRELLRLFVVRHPTLVRGVRSLRTGLG